MGTYSVKREAVPLSSGATHCLRQLSPRSSNRAIRPRPGRRFPGQQYPMIALGGLGGSENPITLFNLFLSNSDPELTDRRYWKAFQLGRSDPGKN